MKYFVFLLLAFCLEAIAASQGADRTITWHPWQELAEFRVRTGDRYLGGGRWEGVRAVPAQEKAKSRCLLWVAILSQMLRRYAIFEVTNSVTAQIEPWNWTTLEMGPRKRSLHLGLAD